MRSCWRKGSIAGQSLIPLVRKVDAVAAEGGRGAVGKFGMEPAAAAIEPTDVGEVRAGGELGASERDRVEGWGRGGVLIYL
jgi:hypothetical protein